MNNSTIITKKYVRSRTGATITVSKSCGNTTHKTITNLSPEQSYAYEHCAGTLARPLTIRLSQKVLKSKSRRIRCSDVINMCKYIEVNVKNRTHVDLTKIKKLYEWLSLFNDRIDQNC